MLSCFMSLLQAFDVHSPKVDRFEISGIILITDISYHVVYSYHVDCRFNFFKMFRSLDIYMKDCRTSDNLGRQLHTTCKHSRHSRHFFLLWSNGAYKKQGLKSLEHLATEDSVKLIVDNLQSDIVTNPLQYWKKAYCSLKEWDFING